MKPPQIPDEVLGKVMGDCQKVVGDSPSNLNPKGEIKWISSGAIPFSSIKMDGVFTPEHLLQVGKILIKARQKIKKKRRDVKEANRTSYNSGRNVITAVV